MRLTYGNNTKHFTISSHLNAVGCTLASVCTIEANRHGTSTKRRISTAIWMNGYKLINGWSFCIASPLVSMAVQESDRIICMRFGWWRATRTSTANTAGTGIARAADKRERRQRSHNIPHCIAGTSICRNRRANGRNTYATCIAECLGVRGRWIRWPSEGDWQTFVHKQQSAPCRNSQPK